MKSKSDKGFATIEIVMAFAVLILCISAVAMVTFGNQTLTIDSETNNEAISKAQALIEKARADSREDYVSVNTIPSTVEDIYTKFLEITDLTQCNKQAKSTVSWTTGSRNLSTTLSTFLSDIPGALALGGDCDSGITADYDNPGGLVSESIGGQGATALDAVNNRLYVTSNKFPPSHNKDFFVYDFSFSPPSSSSLSLVAELDLNEGLNDVDVADNYAYVASDSLTGELQVIDLTTMTQIPGATRQLPETNTAKGRRIFFYDNKIYIGTDYLSCPPPCTPTQNSEFHIYDVSTPSDPNWEGSVNINHNVNDIFVSGDFAYLATSDNNHELMVININPSSPDYLEHPDDTGFGYNASGNNDGSSIYALGNKIYLGRKQNNNPSSAHDLFVLNKDSVQDGASTTDGLVISRDLGISNNSLVTGIVVRSNLAFVGLDNPTIGVLVLNINTLLPYSSCAGYNFPENSTGIDMSGNFIFTSNRSNDEIQVIYDQPSACTP